MKQKRRILAETVSLGAVPGEGNGFKGRVAQYAGLIARAEEHMRLRCGKGDGHFSVNDAKHHLFPVAKSGVYW